MERQSGRVYVFTGPGKGKTTAAVGLAVRAAAAGERAAVVQFLKGSGYTGELYSARELEQFSIKQFGFGCHMAEAIKTGDALCSKCGCCFRENRNPTNNFAPQALEYAKELMRSDAPQTLVLDEVSHAIKHGLIKLEDIMELITTRPLNVSIVLTGRNMPPEIIAAADEASECTVVKHPIANGIDARRGIEY